MAMQVLVRCEGGGSAGVQSGQVGGPSSKAAVGAKMATFAREYAELAQVVNAQAGIIAAQKKENATLSQCIIKLQAENQELSEQLAKQDKAIEALTEKAKQARELAWASGGVASGLGFAQVIAATGPVVFICGAAGGLAAVAINRQLTGEKL